MRHKFKYSQILVRTSDIKLEIKRKKKEKTSSIKIEARSNFEWASGILVGGQSINNEEISL